MSPSPKGEEVVAATAPSAVSVFLQRITICEEEIFSIEDLETPAQRRTKPSHSLGNFEDSQLLFPMEESTEVPRKRRSLSSSPTRVTKSDPIPIPKRRRID